MSTTELLQPTALQQELAEQINKQLEDGFKVTFYRVRGADGEVKHAMIWQIGERRKSHPPREDEYYDVAGIVRDMRAWRARLETVSNRYTTEVPEDFFHGQT